MNTEKLIAPYIVSVQNTTNEIKDFILFGSLMPIEQEGLSVRSMVPLVSYDDILIELFLRVTKINRMRIAIKSDKDYLEAVFKENKTVSIATRNATGSSAYIPLLHQQPFNNHFDYIRHDTISFLESKSRLCFLVNVFTSINIPVLPQSSIEVYLWGSVIKEMEHGKELYNVVSSPEFIELLKIK